MLLALMLAGASSAAGVCEISCELMDSRNADTGVAAAVTQPEKMEGCAGHAEHGQRTDAPGQDTQQQSSHHGHTHATVVATTTAKSAGVGKFSMAALESAVVSEGTRMESRAAYFAYGLKESPPARPLPTVLRI